MKDFAQDFCQQATKMAYSNADLIERIKHKQPEAIANLQMSMELNSNLPLHTWPEYLQQVVEINKKVCNEKATAKTTQHHSTSMQLSKTHNAMDMDSMQKKPSKEKMDLTLEQLAWHKDGKCILCGTHKWVYKEKCTKPLEKYKGKAYNVPRHLSQFFRVSASNVGHMTHHMTICPSGLCNLVI
jgi:S-adenosylmethionine/arginine decarboxylase-like enzyme